MTEPSEDTVFGFTPIKGVPPQVKEENLTEAAIIRRLKAAYGQQFERRMRRKYSPNSRAGNEASWKRIAKVCMALHAEPEHYIDAQFMYCRSLPLVNTLHADTAQKKYATYRFTKLYNTADEEKPIDTDAKMMSPGRALLQELMDTTIQYLTTNLGYFDLNNPETIAFVKRAPWTLNPVGVLALTTNEPYLSLYSASAKEVLDGEPALEQALREDPNYAVTVSLIHEHTRASR